MVSVRPKDLMALARNPAVVGIYATDSRRPEASPRHREPGQRDVAARRRAARAAGGWTGEGAAADPSVTSARDAARPTGSDRLDDWFEVRDGHRAQEAWSLGFRGKGVRVAVLDEAVAFGHPDLVGTWAVLPAGHPYAGWPQVFDPEVGLLAASDRLLSGVGTATPARRFARGGMIELYQEAAVRREVVDGRTRVTACLRPLAYATSVVPRRLESETCDFALPDSSKSGRVRFGHHPDPVLMQLGAREGQGGEWAGVIIVDEAVAGQFDTVYVDLDNDRDFSDEKPVRQDSPLAWRDTSRPPDGIQDLSGGLLYWISDGVQRFPGSWVWGLEDAVPARGTVIGLHWVQGAHGTMCASSIVLFVGLAHTSANDAITSTHIHLRYDCYAYQPWPALTLGTRDLVLPAGSGVDLDVSLEIPSDAGAGMLQGAIVADYDRSPGDAPLEGPGGWELPVRVRGGESRFNMTRDQLSGAGLTVSTEGATVGAGETATFQVCPAVPAAGDGPLRGLVLLGPAAAPGPLQVPVRWQRQVPKALLPLQLSGARVEGP